MLKNDFYVSNQSYKLNSILEHNLEVLIFSDKCVKYNIFVKIYIQTIDYCNIQK